MSYKSMFLEKYQELTVEHVLLVLMLFVSIFFFVGSFEFDRMIAQFPQFFSLIAIVGTLLLLFRNYLPRGLDTFVTRSVTLVDRSSDIADMAEASESTPPQVETKRPLNPTQFLAISLSGYVILGYLIGLLWATPIFIAVYGYWRRLPTKAVLLLCAVGLGIGIVFENLLGIAISNGILMS